MALRTKTIEYAFPTDISTLAAATRRDLSAITLYVPETTSRTFRSVQVEVTVAGAATVAASMTSWLIGIKLGAVAFNDVTTTLTITNSGDPEAFVFTRDVTSYFTANYGGLNAQTCQVGLQFGALITADHTVKIIITYEYQDSSATTRVRTVRIPLESNTGQLTSTLSSIGTNQIPALDSFLPEASKVYRRVWLEFAFSDGGNAATDFNLAVAIDSDAETNVWFSEQGFSGARYGKAVWDVTTAASWSTSGAHDLKARSTVTARFTILTPVLHVTYEYDHSASARVMNSLMLPAADESAWPGNTATADKSRFERTIWIEEPGTITMVQSGLFSTVYDPATVTFNLLCGAQTTRAYTLTTGAVQAGPYVFGHRIDSGAATGSAITLARGRNVLNVDRFTTVQSAGSNFSSMLLLNYTSDIHADGDGAHQHSTCWTVCDPNNALSTQRNLTAPTAVFDIPESEWYVGGFAYEILGCMVGASATGIALQAEYQSSEGPEAGWATFASGLQRGDAEMGVQRSIGAVRDEFQRWPADPDDSRMVIEQTRQYRICTATTMTLGVRAWLTYHSITFTVGGDISGSSGGFVFVEVFRASSGEKIGSTVITGDGPWSIVWYDDTEQLFATARESSTLLGRSDDGLAV